MTLGAFFVVGTAKAGTTTIHRYLSAQPQVRLSNPKETWYFDGPQFSVTRPREDFLQRHIAGYREAELYGEVATSYLFAPHAASQLRSAFPDAMIIATLRQPVERAFSDWWMLYSAGFEHLSFADAIGENISRLNDGFSFEGQRGRELWWSHLKSLKVSRKVLYRTYVDYGYYDVQLKRLYSIFPPKQVHVFFFEELFPPHGFNARLFFEKIGISGSVLPKTTRANPAFANRFVRRFVGAAARLPIRRLLPERARSMLVQRLSAIGKKPRMDQFTRARLNELYRPHIEELELVTGRALSHWCAPSQ